MIEGLQKDQFNQCENNLVAAVDLRGSMARFTNINFVFLKANCVSHHQFVHL